jgi:hypothetical protein
MESKGMRLDAGHGLNLERAEHFISQIATLTPLDQILELDLSQCQHVDPGADWRLANALRVAQEKCQVVVHAPESSSKFSGRWFQTFTKSGLGHALAKHAHRVLTTNTDITNRIRAYYAEPRRKHGALVTEDLKPYLWTANNFVYVAGITEASLDPNHLDVFVEQVLRLLPAVDLHPLAYGELSHHDLTNQSAFILSPVIQLLFEATQNCYDHCIKAPLVTSATISSYLSIRYHKTINDPKALSPELPAYLQRTRSLVGKQPGDYSGAYIEIVVNDDGVGIAARHSLQSDISQHAFQEEQEIVLDAITTRASVKPRSRDSIIRGDPGYGFPTIATALKDLNAFAAIRTGRVLAYFDATIHPATTEGMKVAGLFRTLSAPLGHMPGTNLQVIFPHRHLQRHLPLSSPEKPSDL